MADATIYNPKVAWKTILNNVFQLTKETVDNPATYRATIKSIDSNNVGSGQYEIGFCCFDFMGNPYPIIATGTNTIDVVDVFRIRLCPTSGKKAVIIEPVIDGESLYLSQETFQGMHPLALANAHKYDIPILWDNRGGIEAIEFTFNDIVETTGTSYILDLDATPYTITGLSVICNLGTCESQVGIIFPDATSDNVEGLIENVVTTTRQYFDATGQNVVGLHDMVVIAIGNMLDGATSVTGKLFRTK